MFCTQELSIGLASRLKPREDQSALHQAPRLRPPFTPEPTIKEEVKGQWSLPRFHGSCSSNSLNATITTSSERVGVDIPGVVLMYDIN